MKLISFLSDSYAAKLLIAANLIPLFGVLFYGWDLRFVLVLYWVENIVIGIFNLFKMLMVQDRKLLFDRLFQSAFFTVHYGSFCAAHGFFLLSYFQILPPAVSGELIENSNNIFLNIIQKIEPTYKHLHGLFGNNFTLALSALFISHGFSLIENFFLKAERSKVSLKKLFILPYPRIVVLHITIILGAMLVEALGSPVAILAMLICMKIFIDLSLHKREHTTIQD